MLVGGAVLDMTSLVNLTMELLTKVQLIAAERLKGVVETLLKKTLQAAQELAMGGDIRHGIKVEYHAAKK